MPFGLNSRQQNAWLYEGGGLTMLQELYDQTFGVIQFPAGNTGCQMGGWFREEITSVDDLAGLKMRIAGFGGQVMAKLGVAVQVIAGGEIYQALQTGAIDAAEWVGPYDDLNLGFAEIAQNYYYPGWWEAGPTLEVQVNKAEWDGLPEHYQNVIQAAAFKADAIMTARYDKQNAESLAPFEEAGVQIRPYPDEIMNAAREAAAELYDELNAQRRRELRQGLRVVGRLPPRASRRWFGIGRGEHRQLRRHRCRRRLRQRLAAGQIGVPCLRRYAGRRRDRRVTSSRALEAPRPAR